MHRRGEQHRLISGSRVTAFGTLVSRVLGMLRDAATAALFGLSGGGVMDAFVLAFRIPNLFRRLFGEGVLAASYLPVLSAALERDRAEAWKLVSAVLLRLAVGLTALVAAGEVVLGAVALAGNGDPEIQRFTVLAAIMLPYALFICLAAQAAATLHALGRFALPASIPTILNLVWLAAAVFVAPWYSSDKVVQAQVMAVAIVAAGVVQFSVQIPALRRNGFQFDYNPEAVQHELRQIARAMGPMVLGLMVTQINTLMDSVIAWLLAAPDAAKTTIGWLGGVSYPMEQGAVAALYYGERLYQFPLGILGIAVATAIFPLLSRHAARNDHASLSEDLTLGLRLVLFLGIPAGVGLVMLAEPLARLLYERREFTSEDTVRTARVIWSYALGVWAYCALPVLVRGYYALGDRLTPVRVGVTVVAVNFCLNLALIWPLAEAGLAVATSIGASLQVAILAVVFSRQNLPIRWRAMTATVLRTLVATSAMAAGCYGSAWLLPPGSGLVASLLGVLVPFGVAVIAFLATARMLRAPELSLLLSRSSALKGQ
ncbi:MAG: murein biosynthesis integral membrane protein MurJ [Planctomycetaceae bacterium]|mgnify:CR=1 FL=1|nr:murein biosynthesis integral membrane protein MurJ [Planctomycetaceae bacterium]